MKKKLLSVIFAAVLFVSAMPGTVLAKSTSVGQLNTTANLNIYSSDGEPLIDDTYQYCVEGDTYFAYMWIPQMSQHINGVLFAKSNLSEARVMQSKTLRNVLAKYNIGIVYMHARETTKNPGANSSISSFDYCDGEDGAGHNAGAMLDEAMARFAAVSGYDELRYAPFIGVGHSAGMGPGSSMGSWDPTRTIAQICLKAGTNQGIAGVTGGEYAGSFEIQPGVPTYYESGQFTEHAGYDNPGGKDNYIDNDTQKLKYIRQKGTDRLITMSIEWEAGHYDWSEQSNEMMAAYLDEVIPLRLGAQAMSQEKLPEDYTLNDLTGSGYVSDLKMLGTRTTEYDESEYAHGDIKEFTEDEQKNMMWIPSESLYNKIRNFTNNRKDLPTTAPEATKEPENRTKTVFASYETQFSSSTGEIKSGNYVRYDNNVMFVFDTADMSGDYPIDKAAISFTVYHGNTTRSFKLTQYNEAQDRTTIEIPSDENSMAVNESTNKGGTISVDVTSAVKSAISDGVEKVYFALTITDAEKAAYEEGIENGSISGFPSPYHGSDMYFSVTDAATDENRPQMNISYRTDNSRIYPDIDKAFGETSGIPNWWQGDLHYLATGYDILLGFDMSKVDDAKALEAVKLSLTRTVAWGGHPTNVYLMSENPWESGIYDPDVVAAVTDDDLIAEYDGNSVVLDLTDILADKTGMVYLLLKYADQEDTTQSGNDYYSDSVTGTTYNAVATEDSQRPQLILVYADSEEEPTEAPIDTKHQYIQMEDPSGKIPKPFTRITRYDAVNPNDGLYSEGLNDDPMTFAMYVDKMNVVSPDHLGAERKVANVSDSPAVITALMAPVEWVGVEQAELTESDIENNVASKWKNVLRWKNNRLYYRIPSQDSYMTLNSFDCYDENGELEFAYTTNAFMIYPLFVSGGREQHIMLPEVSDVDKSFTSFTVKPESSAGLPVDLMVDYGPIRAELNSDGSYTIIPDQIPAGAQYPIECKLVATQFGVNNNGTKINTAEPVEKIFYITDNSTISELPLNGEINQNVLMSNKITGFNVEGSGSITLSMNTDTKFNAAQAAAISAERAKSSDKYYKKHYQFPADYNPYEHWEDYPCEWTAQVTESGFLPLSSFKNGEKKNINLRYLNEIKSEGITSITPVIAQTEIAGARANQWGNGVNIVWQKAHGNSYDSVKVYIKNDGLFEEAENVTVGTTNALVIGLKNGEYTFKITTVKDSIESNGIEVNCTVDGITYLADDFETGDLTSGMNILDGQDTQPVYSWITGTGAGVDLLSADDNHYLGVQNNYTFATQTVNMTIPGGINKNMTELHMDILVDKLENTQSSGQVYIELFNPTTGKSYGIDKGDDFALEDKNWHRDYTIKLSSFNLPKNAETLSQITVLKIGRKPVGGGNNNRRAKIYLDNVMFIAEEPIKTAKLTLSAANAYENNASLPNGAPYNAERIEYLFDGDTSNTNLYKASNQKYVYFDLGAEYKIARVAVTEYTTKGTLVVSVSNEDPETISSRDASFTQILRTNGSTSNGVTSSYEDITDADGNVIGRTATANDIYTVSGLETARYICLGDWSNAQAVAELEIYVVDEDNPPPEKPTDEPEFSVSFGDAQKTDNGIIIPAQVAGKGSLDAVFYVAEYSGDVLKAIRALSERTITETGNVEIECNISTENAVKVLIWDKEMKPLSKNARFLYLFNK